MVEIEEARGKESSDRKVGPEDLLEETLQKLPVLPRVQNL